MSTKKGLKRADADVTAAVAVGAAQLPAAWLLRWIVELSSDPYGRDYGGGLGLAFVVLFAPLYLPVLGLLQAWAQTLPAAALAELTHGRLPLPRWVRHLAASALIGAVWAAAAAAFWDWPFGTTVLVLAALGVLPVLAMAYARGRAWGAWGVWLGAGVGSVLLFVLAIPVALLATVTGLIEEYEPPRLSAAEVTGVWRGANGAELRLLRGGRAELARMTADAESGEEPVVCEGTGTWAFEREESSKWDSVVVRLAEGSGTGSTCGDETSWTIGGTDDEPELFRFIGDPDAGEVRILEPAES
ncbi:hypothetical protein [Streptomyces sp. T028]|uniref:hypothetical protein n=1 Tax=Streptomyces sp. T028 TaxID=3394379 RepID=UPI003A8A22A6